MASRMVWLTKADITDAGVCIVASIQDLEQVEVSVELLC